MLPNWLYGKSLRKLQEILNSGGQTAAGVSYSNTESGLEATNAQDAIDEVVEDLDTKAAQSALTTLSDTVTTLTGTVNGKVGWSDYAQLGAVNLLQNTAVTQTVSGITFTVNSDGSVTATVSSTITATTALEINASFTLPAGTYKLNGCPSDVDDGTTTICRLQLYKTDNVTPIALDNGSGVEFSLDSDTALVCKIRLGSGLEAGTYTFYPMITLASYTGSYVPYAKTNAELTSDVNDIYNNLLKTSLCESAAISVSANTDYTGTITPTAISGYKPIGVIGFRASGQGYTQIYISEMRLDSSDNLIHYTIRSDVLNATVSITVHAIVLYIKD